MSKFPNMSDFEVEDELLDTLIRANPTKSIEIVGYLLEEQAARAVGKTPRGRKKKNIITYSLEELYNLREEYYFLTKSDSLVGFIAHLEDIK